MALASAEAKYDELHKDLPFHDGTFSNWAPERSSQTPFHYRDGVSLWVANIDLTPDDDFLSGRLADQSPDDDAESAESDEIARCWPSPAERSRPRAPLFCVDDREAE
jgi:hypothetical protein